MSEKTLPDKLYQLIRVAMADIKAVEAMPDVYSVDMGTWHTPLSRRCQVCLAGAVMAQTLKTPISRHCSPVNFSTDEHRKLEALNCFAFGCIEAGFNWFYRGKSFPVDIPVATCQPAKMFAAIYATRPSLF